jgi:hypothetical protein
MNTPTVKATASTPAPADARRPSEQQTGSSTSFKHFKSLSGSFSKALTALLYARRPATVAGR